MRTVRRGLWGLALLAGISFLWMGRGDYSPADAGRIAPDYTGISLDGDTIDLADLRGRVVVLNVWATWCRPCVAEMPALQRLHEDLGDEGLSVVAVSVDNAALVMGDPGEAVRAFVKEHGITFAVLLDPETRIESAYPVAGLPITFVIDREGRIRESVLGPRAWDKPEFTSEFRQLLES